MNNRHQWKSGNRLDTILNVLLIVLALGVLGLGAVEMGASVPQAARADQQDA